MDSVMSDQFAKSGWLKSLGQKIVVRIEEWSMRHASIILTVCQALSERARLVAPQATIAQIEDIPLSFAFPPKKRQMPQVLANITDLERQHHLEEKKILLYTGNLQPYQGLDLLLEAWGKVVNSPHFDRSFRLVIIGGPEQLLAPYIKSMETCCFPDTICFLGPRPAEEMDFWMEMATGLVSPRAQGENTPLKIYSYMASGKPIVATRMKTHTQVLTDETAFLVRPKAQEMADAICFVLADGKNGLDKGKAARVLVHEHYSVEVFSKKLLNAYYMATEMK
jgi:glycosyltransferase involved in cell wall biosynthesis